MPIPRLSATHHKNSASASAFQLNMNSATMAQTWNSARKRLIVKLRGWAKVRSRVERFIPLVGEANELDHALEYALVILMYLLAGTGSVTLLAAGRHYCGFGFFGLPTPPTQNALLPLACGEKN